MKNITSTFKKITLATLTTLAIITSANAAPMGPQKVCHSVVIGLANMLTPEAMKAATEKDETHFVNGEANGVEYLDMTIEQSGGDDYTHLIYDGEQKIPGQAMTVSTYIGEDEDGDTVTVSPIVKNGKDGYMVAIQDADNILDITMVYVFDCEDE